MSELIHLVPLLNTPVRLSDYLIGVFPTVPSRKGIKKAIKKNRVWVNGKIGTTGLFVRGGEEVSLKNLPADQLPPIVEQKLEVIYEDEYLAVVYKPAGMVVSGNKWLTVANALPFNLQLSSREDALIRPLPVHRLDYPTSGLLLVGKTAMAVTELGKLFAEKQIQKSYYAISIGKLPDKGEVKKSIADRSALSDFEVLDRQTSARFGQLNLVKLQPATGRRHQLRIHLASLDSPILGDREYGKEGLILGGKGLYLHAAKLEFLHPLTGEKMLLEAALPKKFLKIFPGIEI